MRAVDLSHPIATGMPVYPGDPDVTVTPALRLADDGVAVARLDLGSHAGTHLDAPAHSIIGGRTVDRIPLELLVGGACILRVGPAAASPGERIGIERIAGGVPDHLPGIVCIATGWGDRFDTPAASQHPSLALELAEMLWARGARVLGVDCLSPDPTAAEDADSGVLPVHEFWLGSDGVIVENLVRLDELPHRVDMALLPLRISDGDGSPIRAVAFVE